MIGNCIACTVIPGGCARHTADSFDARVFYYEPSHEFVTELSADGAVLTLQPIGDDQGAE